ncbi:MAG TPA: hypothetical protein PLQ22_02950, partial [Bacilli bacterium]|nr:hypothetical protein [Bacilli bacterium]
SWISVTWYVLLPLYYTTTALAKTAYLDTGIWKYGTTGLCGGGDVYSKYSDWDHTYSYASVKNGKGKTASDTKKGAQASASLTASKFRTDYSYYNFWD